MPTAWRCAKLAIMIKGTNKASWTAFVLLALGCGGRAENQVSASAGGSDAASGSPGIAVAGSSAAGAASVVVVSEGGAAPGVGPIDATGLPAELPMACPGTTFSPQLALPCKVGGPLGGDNVLECYDLAGKTALSVLIPFGTLANMLNRPVQLASFPPVPPPGSGGLTGTVVFTQVDPVGRAFVAQLIGGKLGDCTIPATPFWAVAGDFI
jgi:hypothetical protein